jgi:hypothetical protein
MMMSIACWAAAAAGYNLVCLIGLIIWLTDWFSSTCCPTKKFEDGAVRVDIDGETYRGGTAAVGEEAASSFYRQGQGSSRARR